MYFCNTCGETDQSAFRKTSRTRCRECHKKKCKEWYRNRDIAAKNPICLHCGEKEPINFFPNCLTACKTCYHFVFDPIRSKEIRERENKCVKCGATEPRFFNKRSHSLCKTCLMEIPEDAPTCQCGESRKEAFFKDLRTMCKTCSRKAGLKKRTASPMAPKFTCKKCGKNGSQHFPKTSPYVCKACTKQNIRRNTYPFYDDLVAAQGGEFCSICGKIPEEPKTLRLSVDHDHETGLIRGLLCCVCNFRLGNCTQSDLLRLAAYVAQPPAASLAIRMPERILSSFRAVAAKKEAKKQAKKLLKSSRKNEEFCPSAAD